jgi:hypothetical protein
VEMRNSVEKPRESVSLIPNVSSRVVRVEERMEFGVGSKEQGQVAMEKKRITAPWPVTPRRRTVLFSYNSMPPLFLSLRISSSR